MFCEHAGDLCSPINDWLETKGSAVISSIGAAAVSFAGDLFRMLDENEELDKPDEKLRALRAAMH